MKREDLEAGNMYSEGGSRRRQQTGQGRTRHFGESMEGKARGMEAARTSREAKTHEGAGGGYEEKPGQMIRIRLGEEAFAVRVTLRGRVVFGRLGEEGGRTDGTTGEARGHGDTGDMAPWGRGMGNGMREGIRDGDEA